MSQYYRYCVELIDGGSRIRLSARDVTGETVNEPDGECGLSEVPPRIGQLVDKVRRGAARPAEMDELGEALFEALFPAQVATHLRTWLGQVSRQDALLRLELDLDEAQLPRVAALPWEFLRAPQTAGWAVDNLGVHPKVTLSRRRRLWDTAQPITLTEPLRIQLVVAAPEDLGKVVYEPVEAALRQLASGRPGQIAPLMEVLHQPNATSLDRVLEDRKPHILHFIGHGQLRRARGVEFGELALVGPDGRADWRTDEEVGELFQSHVPQVVLLQVCESGAEGSVGAFAGVASQVVQRNAPVVVAMQYPVSNAVAVAFAKEFYRRLGKCTPVDVAVQMGRRVLRQRFKDTRDFAAPVLFMRVKDGRLFTPEKPAAQPEENGKEEAPALPEEPVIRLQPFPDRFTTDLPHPIAHACAAFNAAQSDKERFESLDGLLSNVVKYMTAIALSQYWQDNPDKSDLRAWLAGLSESRLRTSLDILNRIADHYAAARQKPDLYPILFQPYLEAVGNESPLAAAYRAVGRLQPNARAHSEDITPCTFLVRLLDSRQLKWESHPGEVDAAVRGAILPTLWAALKELLNDFQPIFRYRLYYIERFDKVGKDWVYTLIAFPGAEGKPVVVEEPFRQTGGDGPSYKAHCLYLCSSEGRPWLNLHPILISHLYCLYFLEHGAEKGELWYRHCASAERYHPPDYYHFLSGSWAKQSEEVAEGDDPVKQLKQAGDELEKAEDETRLEEMPMSVLLTHLSDDARQALEIALGESLRIGQFWLGVEFLLMALSRQEGVLSEYLQAAGIDPGHLRAALRGLTDVRNPDWRDQHDVEAIGAQALADLQVIDPANLAALYGTDKMPKAAVTPRMLMVLKQAIGSAGGRKAEPAHLLFAALQYPQSLAVNVLLGLVAEADHDPRELLAWAQQHAGAVEPEGGERPEDQAPGRIPPGLGVGPMPGPAQPKSAIKGKGLLGQVGRDLNALAQAGQLRPAMGESARKAMVQMGLILQQTQANNPILLGDPGVGKTAIVEGFARRLATDSRVVAALAGKRIVDLPPAALLAGTKYRGDLEDRLQKLLAEVKAAGGQTIVFIDEIHTILGGKAEGGLGAIADALKPALARGEFPCIGATTVGEYRRYIEADPALARRFTPVWIEEPGLDEAIEIVTAVARQHLAVSHAVQYPDDVIQEAVRLAMRYIHDEFLPGKAIKLLDQAGPRVTMGGSLSGLSPASPTSLPGEKDKSVTIEIVRAIVSERSGVPLTRLSKDENQRLLQLEARLKERVKGQDEAVAQVARVVKRARAGLADPRRPLGVFLFAGPTGVGKTELALALAEALFDEEDAILRLDMSEYLEKHQVSRLIGSPPGYVGYEEEGQLTGRLRRRPYSVVLLDEIEKAHEDVQHLFLQLFDAGRLTDSRGHLADGRNAIFIMTTNLGAKVPFGFARPQMPDFAAQMKAAIEEHFTPEFLNRIDRIVYFEPLDEEMLLSIFDKQFKLVAVQLLEKGIEVEVSDDFKRAVCKRRTDATRGARPLQRAIEDEIIAPLTDKLLAGELKPGTKVVVGERDMQVEERPPTAEHRPPADDRRAAQAPAREVTFEDAVQAVQARLRAHGLEIELTPTAQAFLRDPLWIESRSLPQALAEFVEQPLLAEMQAGKWAAGDRVGVDKYADHLEFKKLEGEAP